jgi:Flp pilus assembly protein TadD
MDRIKKPAAVLLRSTLCLRTGQAASKAVAALLIALALAGCGDATPPVATSTAAPPSVEEHFNKGNELAQAGQFEQAITEYQAVLEMEPDNISAMTNLGVA